MKKMFRFPAAVFLFLFSYESAFAQFTILPSTKLTSADCEQILADYEASGEIPKADYALAKAKADAAANDYAAIVSSLDVATFGDCMTGGQAVSSQCEEVKKKDEAKDKAEAEAESLKGNSAGKDRDDLLGCAIKTGRISLQMAPFFITYIANFLLAMVGIISILFIVIGGYYYIYGGLVDEKEKGKKTIIHALMGMGIALLAWAAVSAIITAVTS